MNDYYTDEPIGWRPPDDGFGDDSYLPEGTDSLHDWDYFAPDDEESSSWQWAQPAALSADTPDRIGRLVEMIRRQPWDITMAKSFYQQAIMMADYDDDAPVVPYMNYFPTYRDMSVAQLRSYFTLRKMWRQGKWPECSLSYLFVYIYETLMQVGIDRPEEGYEILQELRQAYAPSEPKLERYVGPWLLDYVVYYRLERHFPEVFAVQRQVDALAALLANWQHTPDKTLVDAVCSLSRYDIRKGALFTRQGESIVGAVAAVLRAVIPRLEQQLHHRIETLCLGKRVKRQQTMFANAVFYDPHPVMQAEIFVAPRHRYICQGGLWSRDEFVGNAGRVKSLWGEILHEADCRLREQLGVKPRLKSKLADAALAELIAQTVKGWMEQRRREEAAREAERRRVSIDFNQLGRIRSDAEVVQGRLLEGVDTEDLLDAAAPLETKPGEPLPAPPAQQHTADGEPQSQPESTKEATFLRLFLAGGDWKGYLRSIHQPEGVMVERINDLMMDRLGDIVLEDEGNGLQLVDDYRADLERMLKDKEI